MLLQSTLIGPPAYPAEHGWQIALLTLGNFPTDTRFRPVDDIDLCILFLAEGTARCPDPYDPDGLHVAIWHADLLDLAEHGYISGVKAASERAWESERRQALRERLRQLASSEVRDDLLDHLYAEIPGGGMRQLEWPELETYDDERLDRPLFVGSPPVISLTGLGWTELERLHREEFALPPEIEARLLPLLDAELYDAAVREAAFQLEHRIRSITGNHLYGLRLVEHYMSMLSARDCYVTAYLKVFRAELRTAFKFVRNEFAHNM